MKGVRKMIEKLEKYKNGYTVIAFFIGILISFIGIIWFVFSEYQEIIDTYEEVLNTTKTTQQMSLKSVIWNENIPEIERMSACDVYLAAGYNSATKKYCQTIIERSEF